MKIIKAQYSDLDLVATLFDEYRVFYRMDSDLSKAKGFISERLEQNDSVIFYAIDQSLPIGFVQMYPSFSSVAMQRIYILNDLFVVANSRNKGVATLLLAASEEYALQNGALRLALATEVINVQAQKLYEKNGWQKNDAFIHYNKVIVI